MVFFVAFLALILLIAGGCDRYEYKEEKSSWKFWEKNQKDEDKPSRVFREKCEYAQAFHIFKDHNNRWACKLPDGKVMTDN
jgi:hypothetical protein